MESSWSRQSNAFDKSVSKSPNYLFLISIFQVTLVDIDVGWGLYENHTLILGEYLKEKARHMFKEKSV